MDERTIHMGELSPVINRESGLKIRLPDYCPAGAWKFIFTARNNQTRADQMLLYHLFLSRSAAWAAANRANGIWKGALDTYDNSNS